MAPPTSLVLEMKKQGLSNQQIIDELKNQKFSKEDIREAISQSDLKQGIEQPPEPTPSIIPPPSPTYENSKTNSFGFNNAVGVPEPSSMPMADSNQEAMTSIPNLSMQEPQPSFNAKPEIGREMMERIQEISESIIQEKWNEFLTKTGDIQLWKNKTETDISSLKQEVLRTNEKLQGIEKAVLRKIGDYQKTMEDVSTEMKTLEKVFEKIIVPLTTNIKELSRITKELKKKT